MNKFKTHKDWRHEKDIDYWPKKWIKKITHGRSRRRHLDDETPYKRLDDPWNYD